MSFDSEGFQVLSASVRAEFQEMAHTPRHDMFLVDTEDVFAEYLRSFPVGTNPIFRVRTEHDCACCKQFIRNAGSVISISDTMNVQTVWDRAAENAPYPYNVVAQRMRDYVRSRPIVGIYRVVEKGFGAEVTYSSDANQTVHTWRHFSTGEIPSAFRQSHPDRVQGEYRTTVQVFRRGLEELSLDALETVGGLISSNTLYRGQEHASSVRSFRAAKEQYMRHTPAERDRFVWAFANQPVARFRNTAIGSLIVDLSSGVELDQAVRMFESKVAPSNYHRTSAVVSPKMISDAVKKIEELGLTPALERRFARVEDISVQDVLWVNGQTRTQLKGGLEQLLQASVKSKVHVPVADTAERVTPAEFLALLPEVVDLKVFVSGGFSGNFMSLTAPVHTDVRPLFKWDNNFAWAYTNGVTDSIKERVKRAGGNVTNAQVRVSLSWSNYDDLDIHVYEPNGHHISYMDKVSRSSGTLDVDMNAGGGTTRTPVENVSWTRCPDGVYKVFVHQYRLRERVDGGFTIELENQGQTTQYHYPLMVSQGASISVIDFTVSSGVVTSIKQHEGISSQAVSSTKWGISSEQWVPVNVVTRSPNYWGENRVGNEHLFFILDGCLSDEPTRGVFNEYLRGDLLEHRKVFELVGEKTKCVPTPGQLSGLGFSMTQHVEVPVQLTMRSGGRRQVKIQF